MDHINPVLGALALTAICAAAVSTANSMLLHCSTSLIYDIKRVLKGGEASEEEDAKTTKQLRITILSLGVIAVICAIGQFSLLADGFTYVYGAFGSMFFASIWLGLYIKRMNKEAAFASMIVGLCVSVSAGVIGTLLGLYASTSKVLDHVLMRLCDGLKAIPSILFAICLMTMLGPDIKNVILSLAITSIPNMARIARSEALVVREQTYVEALRSTGATETRILWLHIAPNIISSIIVQMTFVFASSIIQEAALSFLGAGLPAGAPSWGNILSDGKNFIYNAWWLIVYPGIFTMLSVLGFNLFGDGLRDFFDPTKV